MNAFGPGKYGAFVGLMAIALIVVVTIGTFTSDGPGAQGLRAGEVLPPFAAVRADAQRDCGELPCDANVALRAGSGDAGRRAACTVRGAQFLNSCELAERGPVVLGFFATRGGSCEAGMDLLQELPERFPGISVAAVAIKGGKAEVAALARQRSWTFPVGWDRDGAVTNLYSVAVCPQYVLARHRGRIQEVIYGEVGAAELDGKVRRLVAASRRQGWRPPG